MPMASLRNSSPVITIILVVLAAITAQRLLFAGVAPPPSDFGTGSMFDQIASRYDMINRVLALGMDTGWRKRMVQEIREGIASVEAPKLLDVATGTADVALLLAQNVPSASVLGVDPSNRMLDIGRYKVQQAELSSSIELQVADAQELVGLPDQNFDAATVAFGIRNVPDRNKALCEIHRVLKTGSTFCILEFSEPDDSFGFLGKFARFFIRNVVPVLGGILSGAPREYWHLQNSIKDFPSPQEFYQQLAELQCEDSGQAAFDPVKLVQMNFGSVQLYVVRVQRPPWDSDG